MPDTQMKAQRKQAARRRRGLMLIGCTIALQQGVCSGQDSGAVTIGGVTYDHVDPGEPFVEAPRRPQDWKPPEPTAAQKSAGMIAYVTIDPGDYKPDRIPRQQEHVKALSAFLTQGEYEPVWFGVYGLDDLRDIEVTVEMAEVPLEVEVRHLHFWPQRTGWSHRTWYMTPELLLPCRDGKKTVPAKDGLLEERPFDLRAGGTAAFWLTLRTDSKAPAGTYQVVVTISSEGRPPLTLPLKVEVLPFGLRRPEDRHWMLYGDPEESNNFGGARWKLMSDEQLLTMLRDFARHGITGLVDVRIKVDLSDMKSGKVGVDVTEFKRIAALCRQAGLPGPYVCSADVHLWHIHQALGLAKDGFDANRPWPEALKSGVTAVARAVTAATCDIPRRWYYHGMDERDSRHKYAIQDFQCWRAGGVKTFATSGDLSFMSQAGIDVPCFHPGALETEEKARALRQFCAKGGREFWWYGTGCYSNPVNQEAEMFSNRYGAGYLFWKTDAKAQVCWTFARMNEDPFNDFDGMRDNTAGPKDAATAYARLKEPRDWGSYQETIPTIAWESLREGVDDYRYLYTLTTAISRARTSNSSAARDAASRAKIAVDALLSRVPWMNAINADRAADPNFNVRQMQRIRRAVADLILELEAAMSGEKAPRAKLPQANAALVIQVTESNPSPATSLPRIRVLPGQRPPKIDGILNDPCWQQASVASGFRYNASGRRADPLTFARMSYDENALYVAFDCREPAMGKLVAKQHGHDASTYLDDCIELFVAGDASGKYIHVVANTNGSIYDAVGLDPTAWDATIETKVATEAGGWTIELALPWKDLSRAGVVKSSRMSVNFCRSRYAAGAEQYSAWSAMPDTFHDHQHFGIALVQGAPALAKPPLQIPGSVSFVSSTRPVEIPFNVKIDSTQCAGGFKIRIQTETGGAPLIVELPAKPNEQRSIDLDIRGRTTLQISLLDASGKSACPTVTHIIFASP